MYARQPKGALRARSGHNGRKSKTIPLPGNLRRFMPIGGTPTEKRKSGKADVQRKRGRAGIRPKRQNARTFWKFRPGVVRLRSNARTKKSRLSENSDSRLSASKS